MQHSYTPMHKNRSTSGPVFMFSELLTCDTERKAWWMYSLHNQILFTLICLLRQDLDRLQGELKNSVRERRKDDEGGKGKRQYIVTYTGLSELQQMASCGAESKDDVVIAFHMKDLSLNRCCGKHSHCQSVPEWDPEIPTSFANHWSSTQPHFSCKHLQTTG